MTASDPVSVTEIAALLAWARSLSNTDPSTDPGERAAYQATKSALLARLTPSPDNEPAGETP